MYALVAVKFRDRYLRKRLIDTGSSELMEWVKSKEGFWSSLTYAGRAGQNMLGQILMQVREFIRTHQTVKSGSDVTPGDRAYVRDCNQAGSDVTPGDRAYVRDCNQAPGAPVENFTRCSAGDEASKTAQ